MSSRRQRQEWRARGRNDRGSILVISALLMTAMLGMAALVLDLAALRQHRTANRAIADHAAMAGAMVLASEMGTTMQACEEAWAYFVANSRDASLAVPPPCAAAFAGTCDATVARPPAVGTVGAYTVSITNPVLDADPLMQPDAIGAPDQAPNPALDGTPCERTAVHIVQRHLTSFAGAIGVRTADTRSHSVARSTVGTDQTAPVALLLLEREACDALTASGNATVVVRPNGPKPGYITIDSSAKGCGSGYAVDASGTPSRIIAEPSAEPSPETGAAGVIRQYALAPGQGNARAYDPADVAASSPRISPAPTPALRRMGRSPVDHRYNCQAAGHDNILGSGDDCMVWASRPAHIKALVNTLGSDVLPSGYQLLPGARCTVKPGETIVVPRGNWWLDCDLSVKGNLTFESGSVVVNGRIDVTSQGSLTINATDASDEVLFVKGDFAKTAQGTVILNRTAVYLDGGHLALTGGSGPITWEAPTGGVFEDLALWSESPEEHKLAGQANIIVNGVLFAPNADPFTVTGGGGSDQTIEAQFITRRLDVNGSGTVGIQPNADRVVEMVVRGARLVR